jgi:hopanoid biosynthesis associated protein HpnK
VITADDFGLAPEVNDAVELAHRSGILTAASLMVAGPAAAQAVALAKRLPSLKVGLHLVLVEGAAVLPPADIAGLVDARGEIRRDMVRLAVDIALKPSTRRQLRREIAAQFDAFRRTGLPLDHVNAHKHFHVHPVIAAEVFAAGRAYGMKALRIPFEPGASPFLMGPWCALLRAQARRNGVKTPDAVVGLRRTGAMTAERLRAALSALPPGLIEIYTHPATSDDFAGHASGYRYRDELAGLTDADVIAALRASRRRAGGFADFLSA